MRAFFFSVDKFFTELMGFNCSLSSYCWTMNFEFNWIHKETGKLHCGITSVCVSKIPFFKYALILGVISLTAFNSLFLVTLCFLWSPLEYDFDPGFSWWVERTNLVQMFMLVGTHSFLPRLSQPFFSNKIIAQVWKVFSEKGRQSKSWVKNIKQVTCQWHWRPLLFLWES